jgi:7-keto-8-aminopelargonate synthetase-like enzyme
MAATDWLMQRHGIYIQSINYPTMPKGIGWLRAAPDRSIVMT